jgi:hypothetical protein
MARNLSSLAVFAFSFFLLASPFVILSGMMTHNRLEAVSFQEK